ncbi:MAG: ATP-binding cassette domain-containing protein [Treponema sp.]|nr:ATP-binding cassette domain-containing protein [Treponema sp.]
MLFDVQNVSFSSNHLDIVKNVSLQIEKGTVTGILGKSGSGKTTLAKLVSGILVPTGGKVLFEGKDIQTMTKQRNLNFRRRCAFVFQNSALWANQNILQNLMLPLDLHYRKMTMEEKNMSVQSVCAMVNFTRSLQLRPADLSAGEQKKIAFARAMITGPEILFLDEVIAGLDIKSATTIINLLHSFVENGNTLIYVSHDNSFIREFPGIMHIVDNGELVTTMTDVPDVDKLMDSIEDRENEYTEGEITIDGIKIKI